MGQQQLLFILLGILIVGLAIALSVSLFRSSAVDSKRDILVNECTTLATMALDYYRKPASFGGGGNSFTNWHIPEKLVTTVNGSFEAQVAADNVVITGTGNEIVTGNDSIKVKITVLPNSYSTEIIN